MMHKHLILYDIFHPKRLQKVRKIVSSYALEGQKSALEAPLDKSSMRSLISELSEIIKTEDKVNIIRVSKPILLGKARSFEQLNNGVIIV